MAGDPACAPGRGASVSGRFLAARAFPAKRCHDGGRTPMPSDPKDLPRKPRARLDLPSAAQIPWPSAGAGSQAVASLLRDAEVAWGEQDYAKAIALIGEASRREPGNPALAAPAREGARAPLRLRRRGALHRRGACGLRRAPRRRWRMPVASAWSSAGSRWPSATSCGPAADAEASIGALVTLADIYVRERRLADAARLAARAARIDRDDPRVLLAQAELSRRRGDAGTAEPVLRALAAKPASGPAVRIRSLYELADILDALRKIRRGDGGAAGCQGDPAAEASTSLHGRASADPGALRRRWSGRSAPLS